MKKLLQVLTMTGLLLGVSAVHAQVNTGDIKATLSKSSLEGEENDQVYEKLEELVQAKRSNVEMKELLQLCLSYSKLDKTDAGYDLIYELKKSNKEEFDKALRQLPKEDRARIKHIIKISEEEIKYGNG